MKRRDLVGRFRSLLSQFEFHIFLLVFGFLLLSWPILGVFEHQPPGTVQAYLFIIWAVLIVLLYCIHKAIRKASNGSAKEGPKGG